MRRVILLFFVLSSYLMFSQSPVAGVVMEKQVLVARKVSADLKPLYFYAGRIFSATDTIAYVRIRFSFLCGNQQVIMPGEPYVEQYGYSSVYIYQKDFDNFFRAIKIAQDETHKIYQDTLHLSVIFHVTDDFGIGLKHYGGRSVSYFIHLKDYDFPIRHLTKLSETFSKCIETAQHL